MIPFAALSWARRLFENQSQKQQHRPDESPDSTAPTRNPAFADGIKRRKPVVNLAIVVARWVWRVAKRETVSPNVVQMGSDLHQTP